MKPCRGVPLDRVPAAGAQISTECRPPFADPSACGPRPGPRRRRRNLVPSACRARHDAQRHRVHGFSGECLPDDLGECRDAWLSSIAGSLEPEDPAGGIAILRVAAVAVEFVQREVIDPNAP
jgi:hypothetical protein